MRIIKLVLAAAATLFILSPKAQAEVPGEDLSESTFIDPKVIDMYGVNNTSLNMISANTVNAVYSAYDYKSGVFDVYKHLIASNNLQATAYDNSFNAFTMSNTDLYTVTFNKKLTFTSIFQGDASGYTGNNYIRYMFYNDNTLVYSINIKVGASAYTPVRVTDINKVTIQRFAVSDGGDKYKGRIHELEFFIDPASVFSSVSNLKANPTTDSIGLSWSNIDSQQVGTKIYFDDILIYEGSKISNYTINNLVPNKEYKATVSSVYKDNGKEVEVKRDITSKTLPDTTPPENPSNITLKQEKKSVVLNWINATNKDFSSVNIYKNDVLWLRNVTGTTATDSDVDYKKTYSYRITSVDLSGNESSGVKKSIKLEEIVTEIKDLKAVAKDFSEVLLTWKNPEIEDLETITIYRKTETTGIKARVMSLFSAGDDYTPIFQTNGTLFKDLTVSPSTTYEYKLTSLVSGEESEGVNIKVTTPQIKVVEPELEKDPNDKTGATYIFSWEKPTIGKVKIIIDGKEFTTVNAANKKVTIPSSELKFDVLGNPRYDLIQVIAIDENGNEGEIIKPINGGDVGGVNIADTGLTGMNLLKMGVNLLGLVGIFVLLGLAFPMAKKMIESIRISFISGRGKNV